MDRYISVVDDSFVNGIYHKVDDFNFEVINNPFPQSIIHFMLGSTFYSQLIRFFRLHININDFVLQEKNDLFQIGQDSKFKIQNSFIASDQTYYDIQHRHISINYKYQYKYSNNLSWEQRELEILSDLWAPCLFHIKQVYINRGAEGATEKLTENDFTSSYTSTTQWHVVHNLD